MRMRSLAAASALALALTVAGCGGDDSSAGDTTAPSAGAVDTTTGATTDTTATGGESTDTTASFTGSASSAFCAKARALQESQESLDVLGVTNPDPQELRRQLTEAGKALDELGDDVPSEIRDDYRTFLDGWNEFTDLLANYDYDFSKLMAAAAEDPALFESGPFATLFAEDGEFARSAERIGEYFEQVCGVTSGG